MIQNYNQNIKYWWLYDGQSTQLLGDVCGLWEYIVELIHNATFRYVVMTCCTLQNILRHHDNAKFAHMNGHWKAYNNILYMLFSNYSYFRIKNPFPVSVFTLKKSNRGPNRGCYFENYGTFPSKWYPGVCYEYCATSIPLQEFSRRAMHIQWT